MKIPKIHKLETGDAIPSLDKCRIINIGPIKEGSNGLIQFITVADENDVALKVLLKCDRYFLDVDKYYEGCKLVDGWTMELLAGPPKKGIPQGVTYMADKERIIVTDQAGTMKISHVDHPVVENPDHSTISLPEDKAPAPAAEAPKMFGKARQSTEELEQAPRNGKRGGVDELIIQYTQERLYIYDLVQQTVNNSAISFPADKIAEIATSIHIQCERSKKDISILPPKESKARIDAAYTNGNNPSTPKAPEVEAPKAADRPNKSVDAPAPAAAAAPVQEEKKSAMQVGSITEYIIGCATEDWYHVQDASGNDLGLITQDDTRRAKVIRWYLSNDDNSVAKDPLSSKVFRAIKSMLNGAHRTQQHEMIFEGMRFDQSTIEDLDYSESNILRFDANIVAIVNRINPSLVSKGNPFAIAEAYFSIDADDRIP